MHWLLGGVSRHFLNDAALEARSQSGLVAGVLSASIEADRSQNEAKVRGGRLDLGSGPMKLCSIDWVLLFHPNYSHDMTIIIDTSLDTSLLGKSATR